MAENENEGKMSEEMLAQLIKADERAKGRDFDETVRTLMAYYEDRAQSLVIATLKRLGLGLPDNPRPIQPNLLRRVVDRIAVVYQNPPSRWLKTDAGRVDGESSEHQLMVETLDRSEYNLAWRRADHIRSLAGQAVIRAYPSDAEKRVVLRVMTPDLLLRMPSPHAPDLLSEDSAFALKLSGGIMEYWEKTMDGWRMSWIRGEGDSFGEMLPIEQQPLAVMNEGGELLDGSLIYPNGEPLPVHIVRDDWAGGRPWLAAKQSRLAWAEAITAIVNDLWNLIANQSHDQRLYKKRRPTNTLPKASGPGSTWEIDVDEEVELLSTNPKIEACKDVLKELIGLWMISEDLPANELDDSKQITTGAALKTQERPLIQRMEAQIPLAQIDERIMWDKFRSVHNQAAQAWGEPMLSELTELEVEIPEMVAPTDPSELAESMAKRMALGAASTIDYIQRDQNVARDRAIDIYTRIAEDMGRYPVFGTQESDLPDDEFDEFSADQSEFSLSALQSTTDVS